MGKMKTAWELVKLIDEADTIYKDKALTIERKYELIFNIYHKEIDPLMKELNVQAPYLECGHAEKDTPAMHKALMGLRKTLP